MEPATPHWVRRRLALGAPTPRTGCADALVGFPGVSSVRWRSPTAANPPVETAGADVRWGVLALLAAAWLSLSGPYTLHEWLILAFGVLSVTFVWRLHLALDRAAGGGSEFFRASSWLRLPRFLIAFALKTAAANLHVTKLILSPKIELHPRLRRVRASQKTAFGQVLYANFITLTPGTITLDLRDDELLVYALDAESEAAVMDGSMDRDALRIEGGSA